MIEAILAVYGIGALLFFIATIRDKYVELNSRILMIFLVASILWPLAGLIYILDSRGN